MYRLFLMFFVLSLSSCYHTERNCTDYKTGDFEFAYTIDGVEKKGKFTRTESLNIDYFENKIDSASIRWINDCEFIQKKLHPKSMSEEKAIHFKILSTTENSYTFEYTLAVKNENRKRYVAKGTAYRID